MTWNELFRRKSVERILQESERGKMEAEHGGSLERTLRVVDLTALGHCGHHRGGHFGTVGQAAFEGGPAVSLLSDEPIGHHELAAIHHLAGGWAGDLFFLQSKVQQTPERNDLEPLIHANLR